VFPPVRLRRRALSGSFRGLELSPDAFTIMSSRFSLYFMYITGALSLVRMIRLGILD
jgi:hypothetical protein